jgi:hypothetical protein
MGIPKKSVFQVISFYYRDSIVLSITYSDLVPDTIKDEYSVEFSTQYDGPEYTLLQMYKEIIADLIEYTSFDHDLEIYIISHHYLSRVTKTVKEKINEYNSIFEQMERL